MRRKTEARKSNRQRIKLGLPDLEHVKSAVLVSLRSPESQRSYRRSIEDFVCWYCSEPRLSFNKTVVTRYRIHLEDQLLAPGTINVRLAAVRRLAYEAADTGLQADTLPVGIPKQILIVLDVEFFEIQKQFVWLLDYLHRTIVLFKHQEGIQNSHNSSSMINA